MEYYNFYNAPG